MKPKGKIQRFEDLIVWQKSLSLAKDIYQRTNEGAFAKDWGLRDQIRRASVSILSNIAEGFGRYSGPEFKKYLAIANGSSYEVRAQCHLARELGYLSKDEADRFIGLSVEISKMIRVLRRRTGDK
jgi:four helix bundle protein